jgi:hypothetical protein
MPTFDVAAAERGASQSTAAGALSAAVAKRVVA